MRPATTFAEDYEAYLASQKQLQSDRSMKDIENYELVSNKVSSNFAGAGPCNDPPPTK